MGFNICLKGALSVCAISGLSFEGGFEEVDFDFEEGMKSFDYYDRKRSFCDDCSLENDSSELNGDESLLAYLLGFGISYWIESKNAWSYEDDGTREVLLDKRLSSEFDVYERRRRLGWWEVHTLNRKSNQEFHLTQSERVLFCQKKERVLLLQKIRLGEIFLHKRFL